MSSIRSFLSNISSFLLLLFLHLGCFSFSHPHRHRRNATAATRFKRKLITQPKQTLVSFFKTLFSPSSNKPLSRPVHSIPSPSSSTRSLRLNPVIIPFDENNISTTIPPINHIHPCSICGEIFHTPTLLEHHQSTRHPVSELIDGENIIRIIFQMGWPDKSIRKPIINRILKIHNNPKIITRFEEYRDSVKSRAAAKIKDPRCIADGNELLRFHCTTFICDLDSVVCNQHYCSACGIIKAGFSNKMDGISTFPTSWRAHAAVPEDLEEEFRFMHVKRALLVCRVIAGRVGSEVGRVDKEDNGFDSLVGRGELEDELVVFNPRAVLPCFVIIYTV